jgi:hypothetical protein
MNTQLRNKVFSKGLGLGFGGQSFIFLSLSFTLRLQLPLSLLLLLSPIFRQTDTHRQKQLFCRKVIAEIENESSFFLYCQSTSTRSASPSYHEDRDGNSRYLVATDAAAEGLNLQKRNIMFNYDLHWNPMKIEQRIGRIHRLARANTQVTASTFLASDLSLVKNNYYHYFWSIYI